MLEVYGVDVLDPAVSTRRVAVLLERLPPYARRPGEHWSTEAELLAVVADQLAQLTWVTLRAAGARNVARPRPIPRPGDRTNRRGPTSELGGPARGQAAAPETAGQGKAGTWADAIRMLAGTPGMRRRDG
jgi:hypothetical protein